MKSVAELDAVRERARAKLALRNGYGRVRVAVAMGTCGIASGARDVLLALVDEVEQRALLDVVVTQSGCRGLCEREPMIEVQVKGQPPVTYGDLTAEKVRAIVAQHLEQGVVIEEWVVTHGARPEPTNR